MKALALHGGAGSWRDSEVKDKAMNAVKNCAEHAFKVLTELNSAVEAVVEAVKCMEDSGYLNAGAGSVLDLFGGRSLDAGLMSSNGLLGAVAAVRKIRNPILLARFIAENTPHVLLAGPDADELGLTIGLPKLEQPPLHVVKRYKDAIRKLLAGELKDVYYSKLAVLIGKNEVLKELISSIGRADTVGAVALDENNILAAATSTGGVILKYPGRVGDTPIPGAGFYSSENLACSATGYGEIIIREMPCLKLDYYIRNGLDLQTAAERIIAEATTRHGPGNMGFIAVDKRGDIVARYNTEAMLVAIVGVDGSITVTDKP
ncbi:isoaspartyl peptidase/L-asparaginase [Thermogladius sp. 4427co]|uniref:isoaspartyl peptidase/L-asparaginase n=1 Tax=Thermogladius sp. 4427co TaxID=3450718 RepID=UPI003F796E9D